jgi:hypothetical protein
MDLYIFLHLLLYINVCLFTIFLSIQSVGLGQLKMFSKTIRKLLQNVPKISQTSVKGVTMARTKVHRYLAPRYLYIFMARAVYRGNLIFTRKNVLSRHLKSCYICLPDFYRYSLLLCHLKPRSVKPKSIVGNRKEFSSPIPLYPSYLILP